MFWKSKLLPPNLVFFSKIYLGAIWCSKFSSIKFDVTMTTIFFDRWVFRNFEFSFSMKKYHFHKCDFYVFRSFSCFFAGFDYSLVSFDAFRRFSKNQEVQDGGSKMAAVLEHDVFRTSYAVISSCCSCCGPQRKHFLTNFLYNTK